MFWSSSYVTRVVHYASRLMNSVGLLFSECDEIIINILIGNKQLRK